LEVGSWKLEVARKRPVQEFLQLNTTHRILVDFQLIPRTKLLSTFYFQLKQPKKLN